MNEQEIIEHILYLEGSPQTKSKGKTVYEPLNAAYSNRAHGYAQRLIYPKIFDAPYDKLRFRDATFSRDTKEAIDREVYVSHGLDRLAFPELRFTVQERFRKPEFIKWGDVTVTEWNDSSDLPSELYKLTSHLFLYAYCEEQKVRGKDELVAFHHVIAVNVEVMLRGLLEKKLRFIRNKNPKDQWFIGIKYDDLRGCDGAVRFYAEQIPPVLSL